LTEPYTVTIELFKEDMKFSAGHFTVFSPSHRERLHGHNFKVKASITLSVSENGMPADYNIFKDKLRGLCGELDEYFLIPTLSPHLKILDLGDKLEILHAEDKLLFYKKDLKLLPISNSTVEELAFYLTQQCIADKSFMIDYGVQALEVKVASGEGQYAAYKWERNK